ncbi:Hsp70 family protein [Micromonospora sp. CPCC 205371]|nr:Hsp70 family protein [Micromonospora sp. CPCC 205371]
MRPGELRLAVDYGSVSTAAVLAWPGGWLPLRWDGWPWLSSSVHVSPDGQVATGQQALLAAAAAPEGFEPSPLRRAGEDSLTLAGVQVPVADLVAATLRRVLDEAVRVAGGPVDDVRLVVPAAWGPRRGMWLRQAARRAGLADVRLVPAPVAVADHLAASGVQLPVGSYLVVCDLGGGVEASVLRRGPAGFEVLSTLDDRDAGGQRIDELLAARLDGQPSPDGQDPGVRWELMSAARAAKETLSAQPTATIGLPAPRPPMVLPASQLFSVAQPVLERAGVLTVEAIAAAELAPEQVGGVFLAGGGAAMPPAASVIGEAVGRPVTVVSEPAAAVLGAAQASGPAAGSLEAAALDAGPPLPPLRRLASLAVSGVGSVLVLVQFLLVENRYRTQWNYPIWDDRFASGGAFQVRLNWGALAMASTMALLACLCAAALLASVLPLQPDSGRQAGSDGVQMGGGLLVAAGMGMAISALYAVAGSVYMTAPYNPYLRWALLPQLPLVAVVVVVALLAARWGRRPSAGWHGWLRFPIASIIPGATGMILVEYMHWNWYHESLLTQGLYRFGGLLIGVGAACALVQPLLWRIIVAVPLAGFTALITDVTTTGVLAFIWIMAVTVWWAHRLWQLWHRPTHRWLPGS